MHSAMALVLDLEEYANTFINCTPRGADLWVPNRKLTVALNMLAKVFQRERLLDFGGGFENVG